MKKILLAGLITGGSMSAQAQLIITGVIDGPLSGGVPKAVELYAESDIADLGIYGLESANNGNTASAPEFTFPSVALSAGETIYVASESISFNTFFGFEPDYTSGATAINGDDAILLYQNGTAIDVFGEVGVDGSGEPWDYLDGWAYRNSDSSTSTTFNVTDWTFSGANALDGESSNINTSSPFPAESFAGGSPTPTPVPSADILINEVDADTDGTDALEFIELYDGGTGSTPLDGLVVVLFNGSDDVSYNAFDLDGFSTDENGYFVLGSADVPNVDTVIGTTNIVQNGADAVALIQGDAADFPNDSVIPSTGIVDAIVYGTNDSDDTTLLALLNAGQTQVNESANGNSSTDSNQRCENGTGGARNTANYIQAAPTPGEENCPVAIGTPVSISDIQGSGPVAALVGETVIVEAVVVGDFQDTDADNARNLDGFYLQEEASDEDSDATTSEGIFVFSEQAVELGQIVRVTGTVSEFFGSTQISAVSAVEIINTEDNRYLVTPAIIDLASNTDVIVIDQSDLEFQADLEAYENMLVIFSGALSITEQFNLDRFNEIRLVAGERPYQFTQNNAPDTLLYEQALRNLAARSVVYDDGLSSQNIGIDLLDGFAPYNETTAKRMGDTVTDLSGVLSFSFDNWRVRASEDGTNVFTSSLDGNSPNPRSETAPSVDGNLTLASFNVLNFFTTLDDGSIPLSGLDPRGADNAEELARQQAKLVNAIVAIDADVLGLLELENEFDPVNDGSTAIEVLVSAINDELNAPIYDYVYPESLLVGTDAISAGFIYKPAVVEIAEDSQPAILDDATAAGFAIFTGRDFAEDPIFDGVSTNRNSIAVTFTHIETNDAFTAVVNHFKSKGGTGSGANADAVDGAGNFNQRRLDAAMAVVEWLATHPTGVEEEDHVILGDLNAYAQEEPIQYLLGEGFNNVERDDAYSFVFDGQIGTLDYILLNDALFTKLNEAAVWHINADEADALDYNLDFDRDSNYFDETTATRNSDHDPLYVGLEMLDAKLSFGEVIKAYLKAVYVGDISGNHKRTFKATLKLYTYYGLLIRAKYAYEEGRNEHACAKLYRAGIYSDGEKQPGDLIKGPSVAAIFADIKILYSQHCE